MEAVENMIECG